MHLEAFLIASAFASLATAKVCRDIVVPLTLSARQGIFNINIPQTNIEVTDFVLNVTQQGRNFTNVALTGYGTTSGNYFVTTTFCQPSISSSKNPTIQVLTHGISFDRRYWDLPYDNYNNSYVNIATDSYNYYTLSYDRLGLGQSSQGDPLNEIQQPLEVAVIQALTTLLRTGTFPTIPHAFTKVIHAGHSFGSLMTYTFAAQYPSLTDGIVLTGFSLDFAYLGLFPGGANFMLANRNQPWRLGGLPNGYLVLSNEEAFKFNQLKPLFYSPGLLDYVEENKEPVTLGEILTLVSVPAVNQYPGPVLVFTGDSDLPFCGGNCFSTGNSDPSIPFGVSRSFPNSLPGNFVAYVQPNMGHAINAHYNTTAAYGVINGFLGAKGLAST